MSEIVKVLTYPVDLSKAIKKTELRTIFVKGDNKAHRFELDVSLGIVPADLTGCTVTGYFTNFKEKTTIEVIGNAEGSKAIVTLNKPCYTLHGQFAMTIQIKSGDVEASVFCGEGYMRASKAEKVVYEDYVVYDMDTLLAQIAEMKTATKNAQDAATAANAAAQNAPYINAANNHWMSWDKSAGKYTDTGVMATGEQGPAGTNGQTPYIGSNGNWWIGSTDTGTKAQGPAGQDGQNGTGSGTVTGVEVNGQTFVPDQTGLVKLPDMGGGDVQTVCGVKPDESGNVALSAESVGARSKTWTPTAEEVGALPNTYKAPVNSVNGQTGDVEINVGVTSVNGKAGAVTVPKLGFLQYDAPWNSDQNAVEIPVSAFTNPASTTDASKLCFMVQVYGKNCIISDSFVSGGKLYIRLYTSTWENWGTGERINIIYLTS